MQRQGTFALSASVGGVDNLDLGMPDAGINVRSVTFTYAAPASGDPMLLLYESNPTIETGFYLYWAKLEKGTMATDWSPSPSDPASGVKTSKIEIGSDFIDIKSGGTLTLDAANDIKIGSGSDTLASTIDLSANNSIKLAVSGGTNLLVGTGLQSYRTIGAATNASAQSILGTVVLQPNTTYTISGQYRMVGVTNTALKILVYDETETEVFTWEHDDSETFSYVQHTFTTGSVSYGNHTVRFDNLGDPTRPTLIYYKLVKLEKGTMATDWSPPAPSRPQQAA